ncbi:sulfite exporter TauE/SafE family protein [Helicovermis profundi]|uniref:Probable membrane transporter protein n=1 Tax=Helicovermis profundi TaxID=3065157 RepID=A0AAU9ELK6_9FIRM|nr:sulfite exporter TauE/SafE family protein [Clostridia bacterium S502]
MLLIVIGIITFVFTILLTIAGEGSAIILIPVYTALGFDIRVAMSTALMLNAIAMIFASIRYYKHKLIMYRLALPIIIVASLFSQLGSKVSNSISSTMLNVFFAMFLIVAASMMIFYKPKEKETHTNNQNGKKETFLGMAIGTIAGFLAGLLGIGGGNLILPVLVGLGFDSKKASATTAFIVIFSSLSGFFGHLENGGVDTNLVIVTVIATILAALVGSWLMTAKLKSKHVKKIIAGVLLLVAFKKIFNIIKVFF